MTIKEEITNDWRPYLRFWCAMVAAPLLDFELWYYVWLYHSILPPSSFDSCCVFWPWSRAMFYGVRACSCMIWQDCIGGRWASQGHSHVPSFEQWPSGPCEYASSGLSPRQEMKSARKNKLVLKLATVKPWEFFTSSEKKIPLKSWNQTLVTVKPCQERKSAIWRI